MRLGSTSKPCGHGSRNPAKALTFAPRPLSATLAAAPPRADVVVAPPVGRSSDPDRSAMTSPPTDSTSTGTQRRYTARLRVLHRRLGCGVDRDTRLHAGI